MSENEEVDENDIEREREKLKKLGVRSTWDLLTSKKKKED